jgi:uncharacterized membrane protein YfcA
MMLLLIYVSVGAVTGVLAGLFGVGGGTVIVPALILTLAWQGVSPEVLTHMAIGTSLAAISVTSLSSIYAHQQRGAVDWRHVWRLVPGVCAGVWCGAALASSLSGATLQICFGVFLLAISAQMYFSVLPEAQAGRHLPSAPGMLVAGALIGSLSALFGIGGGSLTVPFLSWRGVVMQRAVATAAAVGFPLALTGALSYAWQGWGNVLLPAASTGFIYWPAFAGIAVASIGFAKIGAQLAHALAAEKLRRFFALFLFIIGVCFLIQ